MMNWFSQIDWQIVGSAGIGTGIVGLIFQVLGKLVDRQLEINKEVRVRNHETIESAQKIISEAQSTVFKEPPRDNEHTVHINNKLVTVDKKLSKSFNSMLLCWEAAQVYRTNAGDLWDEMKRVPMSNEEKKVTQKKLQKNVNKMEHSEEEAQQHALDATERIGQIL